MQKLFYIFIFYLTFCVSGFTQQSKIDSILIAEQDYLKSVIALQKVGEAQLGNYLPKALSKLNKAKIYNALCWIHFNSNPTKALEYAKLQLPLAESTKDKVVLANAYDNLGYLYMDVSGSNKGLHYMMSSLKIKESMSDTLGITVCLNGIANYYFNNAMYNQALQYFKKIHKIEEVADRKYNTAVILGNIGTSHIQLNNIDSGIYYYQESEKLYILTENKDELGVLYANLGDIYFKHKNDYKKALSFYFKAIPYLDNKGLVSVLSKSYSHIAEIYLSEGQDLLSLYNANKSLEYAEKSTKKSDLLTAYKNLAKVYQHQKKYNKAYNHIQQAFFLKDSIFSETNSKQIKEMLAKFDTEKKEQEITLLNTEKKLGKIALEKKSFERNIFLIGLILTIIIVAYVVYSLIAKKKINKLLQSQNKEISNQNLIIEEKNKDITDSINYAQRIQNTILPPHSILQQHFESFIYYIPKDIVSGDFYWIKEVGDKTYFSVVDCTGHGVPGAFMSIIGFNALNKIIEDLKIEKTGEILDELNNQVNNALGDQRDDEVSMRDGMDISICCIDRKTNVLEYSGANNSLYLIKDKENEMEELSMKLESETSIFYEIKSNKMAIGGGRNHLKYETHQISLHKNDSVYLFSDGYADQFGGEKGKKFKSTSFRKLLLSVNQHKMEDQKFSINKVFKEWKGDIEQLDDVCIMGVRI